VVGVDGSGASLAALRWAASAAADLGAEVVAVTAVPPLDDILRDSIHIEPGNWRQTLRHRAHDEWCRPLADVGVPYRVRLIERHAGAALLEAAAEEGADLLVVGVHQHRSLTGRLSTHLSRHAPCPVVAVPPSVEPVNLGDDAMTAPTGRS
jgi:nucleotide-binding universal stress UspA family protein